MDNPKPHYYIHDHKWFDCNFRVQVTEKGFFYCYGFCNGRHYTYKGRDEQEAKHKAKADLTRRGFLKPHVDKEDT
jgi:hypothetical protein